jgi:hypothetical protein
MFNSKGREKEIYIYKREREREGNSSMFFIYIGKGYTNKIQQMHICGIFYEYM